MDSITADAFEATKSRPLPWVTTINRGLGSFARTIGKPIVSSPVISATRVMPIIGKKGRTFSGVSSGAPSLSGPER